MARISHSDDDDEFVSKSDKKDVITSFQDEILAIAGMEGADWDAARRALSKDPEMSYLLDMFQRFQVAMRGKLTEEEMWEAYDSYLDTAMTKGNPDAAPATARSGMDPARRDELAKRYGG